MIMVWTMSFHLDAADRDITVHIEVFKGVVSETVGKAHRFTIRELNMKLLIAEVNHHLEQKKQSQV